MTGVMRLGSLFSGLGLLDVGVLRAFGGGELAFFAEHDPDDSRRAAYCSAVVTARHPGAAALGDVAGIDGARLPAIDGIALGFPCTDISAAGSGRGLEGERSGLWHHVPRILAEMAPSARPAWIIIENGNLLPRRGLSVVLRDLAQLGYDAGWQVIGAVGVGAPHLRERCAVVARRDGRLPRWPALAPWAAEGLRWWTPEREPAPRVIPPLRDRVARAWRTDAIAALGNGVVVPWAEYVATAARDAVPVRGDRFGAPYIDGVAPCRMAWSATLPPAGWLVGGELYEAHRVYDRAAARSVVEASPIGRLYGRMLPTPRRADWRSGASSREVAARNSRPLCEVAVVGLGRAGALLPTPTAAADRCGSAGARPRRFDSLVTAGALLATPTVDGNYNRAGASARSGDGLATQAARMEGRRATLLSVEWVEWLMGAKGVCPHPLEG